MSIERRDYGLEELEIRETENGQTIRGLGVPYNRNSQDLGGFIERIAPGAVGSVEDTDIVMLWQHDSTDPITRQSTGLKLEERKSGIWFEAPASDFTPRQLDLLQRGVVRQMSFGFVANEDEWNDQKKPIRRTLLDISLREISPVTFPAYQSTSVAVRSANDVGIALMDERVVPQNISMAIDENRRTPWSAPTLGDFTEDSWEDLSDEQKRDIAGHYTWAPTMPPDTFGSLSLPHHRASDGAVVWRGLTAAAGRLDQTEVPASAKEPMRRHLARHYREFGEEAPWDRSEEIGETIRREKLRLAVVGDVL